ncbi:AGE family epimerase/isomerase [Butyrivibrio fibrisolvens]|uniref:AGE family epimerase/isomerase n=1 Tax=Butyrivibrio fibrisolvens TaxID=831 RepID=UPI0020BF9B02|nr:AGE family epimerase/isomerase [Butyrivibrio fibrisolvens]
MVDRIRQHLTHDIIPFWKSLRDDEYGGYYGFLDYDHNLDRKAVKGCILNSRILWFFSSAYTLLKDESLLDEARHAYEFMTEHCIDKTYGGIYWSMTYEGDVFDATKHTYNQAFAIYALSAYFEASRDVRALDLAEELFNLIETKCKDKIGYKEASNEKFIEAKNDKLSENGVMADRTMNTLLHVLEAYTELYRVGRDIKVKKCLEDILSLWADKIYNPELKRQEVFFDNNYRSLIDLHSYGHDIETSWLIDRAVEVIDEDHKLCDRIQPITKALCDKIYEVAFDGHSLAYENDRGKVNTGRVWWVQAETVVGFINAYQKSGELDTKYLDAAKNCLDFIFDHVVDRRTDFVTGSLDADDKLSGKAHNGGDSEISSIIKGTEWYYEVTQDGDPVKNLPIVEPWKCPYHNGRMCIEIIRRMQ